MPATKLAADGDEIRTPGRERYLLTSALPNLDQCCGVVLKALPRRRQAPARPLARLRTNKRRPTCSSKPNAGADRCLSEMQPLRGADEAPGIDDRQGGFREVDAHGR